MIVTTFNGCAIKVKATRDRLGCRAITALVNGEHFPVIEKQDEAAAVAEIERTLAPIHAKPIDGDRWPGHFYPPGTYELCDEGIHPCAIGGQCRHVTCQLGYWASRPTATSLAAGGEPRV